MRYLVVVTLIVITMSHALFASNKFALVIGNKDYSVSPLKNSINDSKDMADVLQSLGFEVTLKNNISDVKGMVKAVNEFTDKMSKPGLFVFYYSGHGIQYQGKNYLVPTSKILNDATDIEFDCMDIDRLLAKCENFSNNTNIIILDACRDNPFASISRSLSKGLAVVGKSPSGTLIAYSTSPGKTASDGTGRNGLYTQELLKTIKKPGIEIEDVFKEVRRNVKQISNGEQVPWESSSLEYSVSFAEAIASIEQQTIDNYRVKTETQQYELNDKKVGKNSEMVRVDPKRVNSILPIVFGIEWKLSRAEVKDILKSSNETKLVGANENILDYQGGRYFGYEVEKVQFSFVEEKLYACQILLKDPSQNVFKMYENISNDLIAKYGPPSYEKNKFPNSYKSEQMKLTAIKNGSVPIYNKWLFKNDDIMRIGINESGSVLVTYLVEELYKKAK
jgi:hypothetical protein